MNDTAPSSPSIPPSSPKPSSTPRKTVLLGSVGILFLTILVYAISRPEEKFGPAVPASGQQHGGGMPENHPVVPSEGEQSDAFKARAQRIELLKAQLEGEGAHEAALHLELGNLLYDQAHETGNQGLFMEASVTYELYLAEKPNDHDARTDYAFTLFQTGRLDRAIEELRRVQSENPRHQHSSFNLALMYMEKNIPDSVIHYMRHTAAIDSTTQPGRTAIQALQGYDSTHGDRRGSVAD